MKVLLTGATGFLGSYIAEQLAAAGHSVRALVRASSDTRRLEALPGAERVVGTVEDAASVARAMEGMESVIHAAGILKGLGPEDFERVNVGGTANVLEAARRTAGFRRLVFVSSIAAVGPSVDGRPVSADHPPAPVTHYGRSKLKAEALLKAAAGEVPSTIIRPPMVYGPRDRETLAFFKSVKSGVMPFVGGGRNTLSVIYVEDCARACVQALTASGVESGTAFFVEDGQVYVWREMLEELERALGRKALLRFSVPVSVLTAVALGNEAVAKMTGKPAMLTRDKLNELLAPHWVFDGKPAQKALGWKPEVAWAEGVRRAAAWYRAEGWL
ncbi:MAG TPA: NAD-dependent epimerase/dehydratase family protein [Myxococcaceae bacterium]|nr:NAD-dependent epimerase/dehydratase family protein [Myxococcaceae bacterium]